MTAIAIREITAPEFVSLWPVFGEVLAQHPRLPVYLQELKISNLPVGREFLELEIFRYGNDTGVHVIHKPAGWNVLVTG